MLFIHFLIEIDFLDMHSFPTSQSKCASDNTQLIKTHLSTPIDQLESTYYPNNIYYYYYFIK